MKTLLVAAVLVITLRCATVKPAPVESTPMRGSASWYGEEFSGRTTANGEIFDPLLLTAAHRTLPFGTVLTVRNVKNGQTVSVRINDRGPFIGNRIIDLSYGAAEKIGMIDPGVGTVEMAITRLGRGDREPPVPYVVTITKPQEVARDAATPPPIDFPLPSSSTPAAVSVIPTDDAFRVGVVEERAGVAVRKQVSPGGTVIEEVPAPGAAPSIPSTARIVQTPAPAPRPPAVRKEGFVVQAGAFQVEQNARALREKVAAVLPAVYVDQSGPLFRVRIGPFKSRAEAIDARESLEVAGMSGIVVAAD
ncbi:MAG TPA: septal ring lytic transglycosylase RlpA family protein [Thermoanaerobaculia bacterium]|nr:septal ring lytic transglycosylase RlpA family protein [Thermoanaerobaculia bacterium]